MARVSASSLFIASLPLQLDLPSPCKLTCPLVGIRLLVEPDDRIMIMLAVHGEP